MTPHALEVLLSLDDRFEERDSRFGDRTALWLQNREVAHVEADGSVDLRVGRRIIAAHRTAWRARPDIILRDSSSADWLHVNCVDGDTSTLIEVASAAWPPAQTD